jgi:flagellar protein FlaJ
MSIISEIFIGAGELLIYLWHIVSNVLGVFINPASEFFGKFAKAVHHRLGALFPFHMRERLEEMFLYSGLTRNPEETLGIAVMYSVLFPITAALIAFVLTGDELISLGAAVVSFILIWMMLYMMLRLFVDRRTENIEKVLPDLLSMIAQNMSAGMTPYNALWVAARPEFGPLALEIQKVARDTLTGTPLEASLINMTKRVKSEKLQRTVKLMIQGMRSGGELPTVLQEMARDIRTEQSLVRRMESETTAQVMFIMFSLIVGAPLLFAASSQFINIFSQTFAGIDMSQLSQQMQGGMIKISEIGIGEDAFINYAVLVLLISCFFGSLLIGMMRSGKMTSGIPMIPVTIFLSIGILLALRYVLSIFFWDIMGVGV